MPIKNFRDKQTYMRKYRAAHLEKMKTQCLAHYYKDKTPYKESYFKRTYGLSLSDYKSLLKSARGKCAACKGKPKRRLVVDHCHKTKVVRGLLCDGCNMALGCVQDSTKRLFKLVDYLKINSMKGAT